MLRSPAYVPGVCPVHLAFYRYNLESGRTKLSFEGALDTVRRLRSRMN